MNTLILIVKLLPTIISAVRAIESAIPMQGKGKEKLAAVLGIVEDLTGDSKLVGEVSKVVARIVALFNSTGWQEPQEPAQ